MQGRGEGLDGMNVKGEIERGGGGVGDVETTIMRCAVMLQAASLSSIAAASPLTCSFDGRVHAG